MKNDYFKKVEVAADFIRDKIKVKPEIMLVLSGGLTSVIEKMEDQEVLAASEIPNFPSAAAEGHSGKIVFGYIEGLAVAAFQGRFHYYEGHSMQDVVFPAFVMNKLGVKTMITTNAVGGINKDFVSGDVMLITDHINYMGGNPLRGISIHTPGRQFPDMTDAYSAALQDLARKAAGEAGINLKEGVYIAVSGPSYETRQEIRAFRIWGADAVGMSTVPEIIAANYLEMDTLGFSIIANAGADVHQGKMSHAEVLQNVKQAEGKLSKLLLAVLKRISQG